MKYPTKPILNSPLIGKKCKIVENIDDHVEYQGQELEIIEELPNSYITVTDGVTIWHAGIEETDLLNRYYI